MGMRVDREIDERMNIASASRGAARYIKKNNFYFNNWVYALQAYQMGAGAVLKSVKDSESGAKHMEVTSKTYWYVKKFLAHKIAFEGALEGAGQIQVITYENRNKKTLADLAKEVSLSEDDLKLYNKWAKTGNIPDDRAYTVLIPVIGDAKDIKLPATVAATLPTAKADPGKASAVVSSTNVSPDKIHINGISAIKAKEGENPTRLAERAQADLSDFLNWNDISISDRIQPGQYYLLGKKRARASEAYHKVASGENLWQISQRYGVQIRKLKKYNKIDSDRDLKPDMMLYLSSTKPKDSDKILADTEVVQVDKGQTFAWAVNPEQSTEAPVIMQKVSNPKLEKIVVEPAKIEIVKPEVEQRVKPDSAMQNSNIQITPLESASKKEHTIQAGETLYAIAQQHQVSVMDLVTWNNLNLQQGIKPGQVLKVADVKPEAEIQKPVKAPEPVKSPEIEHEVRASDTLYSIARKYGVTIKDLMDWNGKKDFAVSVGEKLKINQR
jgi:membrane-bound lytic murein transglycosylase D